MLRAIILAIVMSPILRGCDLPHPLKVMLAGREVKPLERQYHYLAVFMNHSKPCLLISERAILYAPIAPVEVQYRYARSQCFHFVAVNTRTADLCDRIKDVPGWLRRTNESTTTRCREQVRRANNNFGGSPDLSVVLRAMGYPEDEVEELAAALWQTPFTEDFFYRIDQMPHFGSAADRREMKAMTWEPPPPPMPMPCMRTEGDNGGGRVCLILPGAALPDPED